MQRFAVIGLGQFGMSLAQSLARSGAEVIAIDTDRDLVDAVKDQVALALRMDAVDEKGLTARGVHEVDVAIIAIGTQFEACTLAVAILKKLGVRRVIARARNEIRARILSLVGADEIINPEDESALRLAQKLVAPNIIDYIELAEGHSVVQLKAPKAFCDKKIVEIDLRRKFGVNLVAIKKTVLVRDSDGATAEVEQINDIPRPTDVIEANDILVIVGSDENISRLPRD